MAKTIPVHIKQKFEQVVNVPTLPKVLSKVISMLGEPRVSAREVAKVISQDQALVSRILRIVNSAFYGFPRQIKTIDHALVILGFNRLKAAIFTASVLEVFKNGQNDIGFDVNGFWEHSIGVGVISKALAKHLRLPNVEEHFIFGLLHDVGKLILDYYGKEFYEKVLPLQKEKDVSLREAELEVIGFDHSIVGSIVFEKWNLPYDMIDVVTWHHDVVNYNGKFLPSVGIVAVADFLTRLVGIGYGGDMFIPPLHKNVFSMLNLDLMTVDYIIYEGLSQMDSMRDFLDIIRG